jgi:DNA primase DnaG DnaB-binding
MIKPHCRTSASGKRNAKAISGNAHCELIDDLKRTPAQIPAQVIERWADKPERESLEKLLLKEEVITSAAAAGDELRAALVKLSELADTQRLEALQLKSRTATLDESELQEFQRLTTKTPTTKLSR